MNKMQSYALIIIRHLKTHLRGVCNDKLDTEGLPPPARNQGLAGSGGQLGFVSFLGHADLTYLPTQTVDKSAILYLVFFLM